jgi:penicillin-binding protein 1A
MIPSTPPTPEPQRLLAVKAALQQQRLPLYQTIIRWMWRLFYGSLIVGAIGLLFINFSSIPSFKDLEDPRSALATEVIAANGDVLGRYFIENRVPVPYEELSPYLVKALVATEDERFYKHCGIDAQAIGRVLVRTVLLRDESAGGGSTITQQLAKMLYSDRNFEGMNPIQKIFALAYRKFREWITAVKLERSYTKEEIMAMYLNQVNFVNNAYGIKAASEIYFGTSQSKLKPEEAATLIGMLQNPGRYNPLRHPERCIRRRMIVLYQMRNHKYITDRQYDSLKVRPLDMSRFRRVTFTDDKAPYLCAALKKDVSRILDAPESRKQDGSKYNIYKDGLKIYTTIDPTYQKHAEEAVAENMRKLQSRFFAVWRGRDPWTYRTSETTTEEVDQRQNKLTNLMREGDRYQSLRPRFLGVVSEKIQTRLNFELRDVDIERMMEEARSPGAISKMVSKKIATSEQASAYRSIMSGTEWPEIKKQWPALQNALRAQYATKTKMKVFSWSGGPRHERDTMMSPMDSLRYHRMFLQAGLLAVDPSTSAVKAWVGGINFKYFQYDHIRSRRQVGSTFKPFVYATAIAQQGLSPCFQVYDIPVTIPGRYQNFTNVTDWTPKNSTNSYSGRLLTLKEALKNSVNTVSAYLMKQMGDTEPVRGLLNNMGIDSLSDRIPKQPSICLGAADLTVMEMTGAYTTFANKGVYARPYVIDRIEDKNGRVIYRSLPEEHTALPEAANYAMLDMLKYNVKGAPGVNSLRSEVGGKTGTTNDYTDGWFMGVTPRLVVGTWVGGEDRWIRFLSLNDGQGAKMARPVVASFLQSLEKDKNSGYDPNVRFQKPANMSIEIDCSKYGESIVPVATDEEFGGDDPFGDEDAPVPPTDGKTPPPPAKKTPPKKPDEGFE